MFFAWIEVHTLSWLYLPWCDKWESRNEFAAGDDGTLLLQDSNGLFNISAIIKKRKILFFENYHDQMFSSTMQACQQLCMVVACLFYSMKLWYKYQFYFKLYLILFKSNFVVQLGLGNMCTKNFALKRFYIFVLTNFQFKRAKVLAKVLARNSFRTPIPNTANKKRGNIIGNRLNAKYLAYVFRYSNFW